MEIQQRRTRKLCKTRAR